MKITVEIEGIDLEKDLDYVNYVLVMLAGKPPTPARVPVSASASVAAKPSVGIPLSPGADALVRFGAGFRVVRLAGYQQDGFWMTESGNLVHEDHAYPLFPIGVATAGGAKETETAQ